MGGGDCEVGNYFFDVRNRRLRITKHVNGNEQKLNGGTFGCPGESFRELANKAFDKQLTVRCVKGRIVETMV